MISVLATQLLLKLSGHSHEKKNGFFGLYSLIRIYYFCFFRVDFNVAQLSQQYCSLALSLLLVGLFFIFHRSATKMRIVKLTCDGSLIIGGRLIGFDEYDAALFLEKHPQNIILSKLPPGVPIPLTVFYAMNYYCGSVTIDSTGLLICFILSILAFSDWLEEDR